MVPKSHKYFSLPAGKNPELKFPLARLSYAGELLKVFEFKVKHRGFKSCPTAEVCNDSWLSHVTDDQETMSEMAYPSRRSRFAAPKRSSSSTVMPLRRLGTLKEVPSSDISNENMSRHGNAGRSISRTSSSHSDSRVLPPRHHFQPSIDNNSSADHLPNEPHQVEEDEEAQHQHQHQPSLPPPAWAAEPRDDTPRNPLLRRPQWNMKKGP